MAASEALLTWGGLPKEGEESMDRLTARLQAMTLAVQAKDAALQDLQSRLQAALGEVEQGRAKEVALRRRAEIAEAAEEALASQMAELEAEAYASITQSSKMQKDAVKEAEGISITSREVAASHRIEELERKLRAAMEEAGGWERRYREAEGEAQQGLARAATLLKRAEAAEEALGARMAELEASKAGTLGRFHSEQPVESRNGSSVETSAGSQEAELQWQRAVHATVQEKGAGKQVMDAREGGERGPHEALLSMSLQELAGMVKLRLWSPSSLTVSSN